MQRFGNFSSSSIWKLTTSDKSGNDFGKPALTYIQEKIYEKELERSLESEINSKYLNWGNLCEKVAFDNLALEYKLISKERYAHKSIENWNGMPDNLRAENSDLIVGDIKCPFTLKRFIEQIKSHEKGIFKSEFPEYYWQLVSNAILTDATKIESIVFVPYESQLSDIRLLDELSEKPFLRYYENSELPYLKDNGKFKNINSFVYDLDMNDVDFLTERVIKANKLIC